jgi:hypothetical protein
VCRKNLTVFSLQARRNDKPCSDMSKQIPRVNTLKEITLKNEIFKDIIFHAGNHSYIETRKKGVKYEKL